MPLQAALITGGTKGIGLEAVRRFHSLNYKIVTCARSRSTWDAVLLKHPELSDVDFHIVDLSNNDELKRFFLHIGSSYGLLKIAVNNASPKIASSGVFSEDSEEQLFNTLVNDLWSPALCLKNELQLMAAGASIVNITSVNGIRPAPNNAMYSAAKHGLEGLTRSVALEAIEKGIRVNSVAPGVTWTPRSLADHWFSVKLIHMRIIGFIGLFLLTWLCLLVLIDALQSGDWKGVAICSLGIALFMMCGYTLWRGRWLEHNPDSHEKLAKGWLGHSVSSFFRNNVLRTPEGLILAAGSLLCFILLLATITVPDAIGIGANRAGEAVVLFAIWPVLALNFYVRLIVHRTKPPFLFLLMLAVFIALFFLVYG